MDQIHDIIEVRHVFGNHESRVTSVYFLVVDEGISSLLDLVTSPVAVCGVTEVIFGSYKHSGGKLGDLSQINFWRSILPVFLLISFSAPVVKLELLSMHKLSIVDKTLYTGTSREMRHIHTKSVWVIKWRILSDQESLANQADFWNDSTEQFRGIIGRISKDFPDMQ